MTPIGPKTTHFSSTPKLLMQRLREVMGDDISAQDKLNELTKTIAKNMMAEVCSIYLRRAEDTLELYATTGLNPDAVHLTKLEWGQGLVGFVANQARALSIEMAHTHPSFAYRPEVGEDKLNGFLGVPIIRQGQVLGVLVAQNAEARHYNDEEIEALQIVAMVLAEIVVAGDLLDAEDRAEMDRIIHRAVHIKGQGIVSGIVIGHAVLNEKPIPQHEVFAKDTELELMRLNEGIDDLQANVDKMIDELDESNTTSREVLEVYRLFAHDQSWINRLTAAVNSGLSAETAVEQIQAENRQRMAQVKDAYLRERLHDLDDLARRLLRILAGAEELALHLPEDAVLFAHELGAAELLELDQSRLRAIVIGEGSTTSHAVIIARSMEIPCIVGASRAVDRVEEGDMVILDGGKGEVHIRPRADQIESFREKQALLSKSRLEFAEIRDLPAQSKDGITIDLMMNAGLAIDLPHMQEAGASGIGLFRTEFQYLIGRSLPTAGDQEELYKSVLDQAGEKPVIFRTSDLGSDKAPEYMQLYKESNPAMGWRGIRMSVDREGLIRPQLRALLAAAAGKELNIMWPLVTTASEVERAQEILDKEIERRERAGRNMPRKINVGAMIEIPSAAWGIEQIAPKVDFMSIGGNDLAQFFFASDRQSDALNGRFDYLHPGFLRFLRLVVEKADATDTDLSYCGEQVADPYMALALIAIGLRKMSLPSVAIAPTKKLIRSTDISSLRNFLLPLLNSPTDSLRPSIEDYVRSQGLMKG